MFLDILGDRRSDFDPRILSFPIAKNGNSYSDLIERSLIFMPTGDWQCALYTLKNGEQLISHGLVTNKRMT